MKATTILTNKSAASGYRHLSVITLMSLHTDNAVADNTDTAVTTIH